MGTPIDRPADYMLKAGNEKLNNAVQATEAGWIRTYPGGTEELLHAQSGAAAGITTPSILSVIFNTSGDLSVGDGDALNMTVNFVESVTMTFGEVTSVTIDEAGEGYLASQHGAAVTFDASDGGGDTAVGTMIITENGEVGGINITDAGSGYTTVDDDGEAVTFADPVAGTTAEGTLIVTGDVVVGVTMTERGSGYAGTETITIPDPTGGGDTATAEILIGGTFAGITITDGGTKYAGTEDVTIPAPAGAESTTQADVSLVTANNSAPTITFDEDGVEKTAAYVSGNGGSAWVFAFDVTAEGDIDNFTENLTGTFTITDVDGNAIDSDFPADFEAPTITVVA